MAVSVSLSARVSPQVRDRLSAEAQARGVPLATYAAALLSGAAPDPAPDPSRPGEGDVQREVECVFERLPLDAGLEREICMALARTVEDGGTAGIAAGKELVIEVRMAQQRYGADWDPDEAG